MTLLRPTNPIKDRFDVQEADKTRTFHHADTSPIGGASGTLYFIGMPGSGRRALARQTAERLGLEYAEAATPEALEPTPQSRSVAVTLPGASDEALLLALRERGKVFYIMRYAADLAAATADAEALAAETARLEPLFMQAAHFILPVDATAEERLESVSEKAQL